MKAIRDNPPRTLADLLALVVPPLTLWVTRWINHLFADDPQMRSLVLAAALGVLLFMVDRVGRFTQRWTEPRAAFDELLAIRGATSDHDPPLELQPDLPPVPPEEPL